MEGEVFAVAVGLTRHEIYEVPSMEEIIVAILSSTRHAAHEIMATRRPGHREHIGYGDCRCGRHG